MEHQSRIFIIIIFGWSRLKLLLYKLFFTVNLLFADMRLHGKGGFERSCGSVDAFSSFGDVVIIVIVEFYEFVERFAFFFAT